MVSEREALDRLYAGEIQLPPLLIEPQEAEPLVRREAHWDASVRVCWRDRTYDFGVEYKSYPTPKVLQQAIVQVKERACASGRLPMLIAPYLAEEKLRMLEAHEVSG